MQCDWILVLDYNGLAAEKKSWKWREVVFSLVVYVQHFTP